MHYKLDDAYMGKIAQCSGCREKFVLERISETLTLSPGDVVGGSSFESSISSLAQEIAKLARRNQEDPDLDFSPGPGVLRAAHESTRMQSDSTDQQYDSQMAAASLRTESLCVQIDDSEPPSDHTGIWNVGESILGIYEVREIAPGIPYAQGGVGIVQRIYHREWDMELAVKSPKPGVFQSEMGMSSYERECETWVELGLHPNIATCYLVRRIGNIPRIFAEFIPDGSLRDWIHDGRIYEGGPEAARMRILDIAIQFAWGLDYAHQQGLLHLDVKPANVMMSGTTPKVTDFGLAQITGIETRGVSPSAPLSHSEPSDSPDVLETENTPPPVSRGVGSGKWEGMTPGYCSPEQYQAYLLYRQGRMDPTLKMTLQSDIWSWAISVLAMFHGRAPCRKGGQTAAKVFELFLSTPHPPEKPAIPPAMIELMRHCFREDPQKRPASMLEVAERLVKIYEQISGSPYPQTYPSSTRWTAESINNRAASLLDLNKAKDAEKLFHEALQLEPWQPEVSYNEALLLWRNGVFTDTEAVERLETLVKMRSEPISHYALGLVQRERGNIPPAIQAFEDALEKESRPEFLRTFEIASKFSDRSIRCTDLFSYQRSPGPIAYLDDKEEILLIAVDARHFVAYDTKAFRRWISLKRSRLNVAGSPGRSASFVDPNPVATLPDVQIAMSEDYQWEVLSGKTSDIVFLRNSGNPEDQRLMRSIPWGPPQLDIITTFSSLFKSELSVSLTVPGTAHSKRSVVRNLILVAEGPEIRILDRNENTLLGTLVGHEQMIQSITYGGRNGQWVISGAKDRTVRIWELPNCRCVRTIGGLDSAVDSVYLSRSGSFLIAFLGGNSVRIWDVGILCRNSDQIRAPILLSRVASSEELSRQQKEMSILQDEVFSCVNSGDFSTAVQSLDKMRELPGWDAVRKEMPWDRITPKCRRENPSDAVCTQTLIGHEDKITSVALSLDGQLAISSGQDQSIRLWNTGTGKCVRVIEGHQDWIRDIALTWDGRYILSGSWDASVRIWNSGTGKCVRVLGDKVRSISKVAFHPLGKIAAIATSSGSVLLWDVVADKVIGNWSAHHGGINSLAFSRDGRMLITGADDATFCFWETRTQDLLRKFARGKVPITAVNYLAGIQAVASASRDGTLEIRRRDHRPQVLSGHVAEILTMMSSVDNRFLFTASRDQSIRIWRISDGALLRTLSGHSGAISDIALDFSGRKMLSGSEDGTLRFWELYWEFSFPKNEAWTEEIRPYLQTLLSLYCTDSEGREPPRLIEAGIQRILLELGYCGFGWVPEPELRREIQQTVVNWPGPPSLPRELS